MPDIKAISTNELRKIFKTRQGFWKRTTRITEAVKDITFDVERGELFGLLGRTDIVDPRKGFLEFFFGHF